MLSEAIRQLIHNSSLPTHQVALQAGLSSAALYHFMQGSRSIQVDTADKILTVLAVSVEIKPRKGILPKVLSQKTSSDRWTPEQDLYLFEHGAFATARFTGRNVQACRLRRCRIKAQFAQFRADGKIEFIEKKSPGRRKRVTG